MVNQATTESTGKSIANISIDSVLYGQLEEEAARRRIATGQNVTRSEVYEKALRAGLPIISKQ